jgi:hypothetical protein
MLAVGRATEFDVPCDMDPFDVTAWKCVQKCVADRAATGGRRRALSNVPAALGAAAAYARCGTIASRPLDDRG